MIGWTAVAVLAGLAGAQPPEEIALASGGAPALAVFLRARVQDTWGLELGDGDVASRRGAFRIVLEPAAGGAIDARIEEAGEVVAARELDAEDARVLEALVWLFVKSSIARAMIAPRAVVEASLDPSREAEVGIGAWSVHVLGGAHRSEGAPAGAAVLAGFERRIGAGFVAGGEAGYRRELRASQILVHHVPISAFSGYDLAEVTDGVVPVSAGLAITADIAGATWTRNDRSSMAPGFLAGPYARARIPVAGANAGELSLLAELGASFFLVRRRYLLDDDSAIDEGTFVLRASAGLDWRWR